MQKGRRATNTGIFSGGAEQMALAGRDETEVVSAARVSGNFLDILGVSPALGRSFLPAEDRPGGPDVAIISTRLWHQHFGGDPRVLGNTATLAGIPYTIIGVLPARFDFPFVDAKTDVWITRPIEWSLMPVKSRPLSPYLQIFGRLKPSVSLVQANAELTTLNRQYAAAHPAMLDAKPSTEDNPAHVQSLRESIVADVRLPLLLLSGAVGLMLFIVSANVASLLLARAATRAREFAVRAAVGAGRGRLLRQLLTESTLLSMLGGIAEGAKQHSSYDREERCVCAYAESHRKNDRGGEAGTFEEHSSGEAEVLPQCAEKPRFRHRQTLPSIGRRFSLPYICNIRDCMWLITIRKGARSRGTPSLSDSLLAAILGVLCMVSSGCRDSGKQPAASTSSDETIVVLRHGEKPLGGLGQISCMGLNRSLALPKVLIGRFGRAKRDLRSESCSADERELVVSQDVFLCAAVGHD